MTPHVRPARPPDADIAIVGAGPAGAAAACHLARIGFRVVLIDQGRFPRDKVCGDFVGPAALAELEGLDLSLQSTSGKPNEIRTGALYLNGRKGVERPFPRIQGLRDHGLCIPRVLLDDAVVQGAVASNARLIEQARVTGYEADAAGVTLFYQDCGSQKYLRSRFLIGADGSSSMISRILRGAKHPRRNRIVAVRAYFKDVEGPADQADLYINAISFPGYYWLFPTGTTTANVGVGILLDAWTSNRGTLGQLLAHLIESDPAIRRRLGKAKIEGKIVGWPLATYNPQLPVVTDRVALLGDAAGLINPLSGEGIQYALRSARWCVEELRDALLADNLCSSALRPYVARVETEMRYDMALSQLIVDIARNRALGPLLRLALEVAANRAASNQRYYDLAAGLFAGIVHAREFLTLPVVLGTAKSAAIYAWAAAIDALRNEERRVTHSASLIEAIVSFCEDSVRHPLATLHWSTDCVASAVELAVQITTSALRSFGMWLRSGHHSQKAGLEKARKGEPLGSNALCRQ